MEIRLANPSDAESISHVVYSLSEKYIAPDCTSIGAQTLLNSMTKVAIENYLALGYEYHVAIDDGEIVGVVGIRDNKHLYHLFVLDSHRGHGIAKELWDVAQGKCIASENSREFTVNSSRYAKQFYEKLGFVQTGREEDLNGVVSIPMRLKTEPNNSLKRDRHKAAAP